MTSIAQNHESDQREIAGTLKKFFTAGTQGTVLCVLSRKRQITQRTSMPAVGRHRQRHEINSHADVFTQTVPCVL